MDITRMSLLLLQKKERDLRKVWGKACWSHGKNENIR
jgi:hypothetical protein